MSTTQSPCSSVGCHDPNTKQCCNKKCICKATQNCVEYQLHNGTIAAGCCPGVTLVCDGICFDASIFKCCAAPGGTHGLCSANQDCCGNMCCDEGAVCANGFAGPMCWQKHDKGNEEIENHAFVPAIIPVPSTQKSDSMKTNSHSLFRVLLFLVQSVAGTLEQAFPTTRLQSPPIRQDTPDMSNLTSSMNKRSSCDPPLEPCGDGCQYGPAHCCLREDGTHGTCRTGDVCCQEYCCPPNTICMVASKTQSAGPWCWPPGLPRTKANVPYDPIPWPHEVDGAGFKNTRVKNGSAGMRPSGAFCVIVILLSLVLATSGLRLVSMGTTAATVGEPLMTVTTTILPHTTTEADIDIGLPNKEDFAVAGHGGHSHGGHNSGNHGGGGHNNTTARPGILRLSRLLI